jgi:hypothetical protein
VYHAINVLQKLSLFESPPGFYEVIVLVPVIGVSEWGAFSMQSFIDVTDCTITTGRLKDLRTTRMFLPSNDFAWWPFFANAATVQLRSLSRAALQDARALAN